MPRISAICFALLANLLLCGCSTPEQKKARSLHAGKQYLEKRDYRRAILQYLNAAQQSPPDADVYYQLGLAHLGAGETRNALGALSKAIELNPGHQPTQLKLAELLSASTRPELLELSQKHARGVLRIAPTNVDALNSLAFTELRLGQEEEAEQHLRTALQNAPGNVNSLLTLALLRLDDGDLSDAGQILRTAVVKSPRSREAWVALGHLSNRLGKKDEAETQFSRAVNLDSSFAPALFGLVGVQMQLGKLDRAEQTWRKISTLPEPEFRASHALFLLDGGQLTKGIEELERLSQSEPNERHFRSLLVATYTRAGRVADAVRVLSAALIKNPNDTEALIQQGALYLKTGQIDEGAKVLDQALGVAPTMAAPHYLMAQVHRARAATQLHRNELRQALELDPQMLAARVELARTMLEKQLAQNALEVLDAAPEFQKRSLPIRVGRNWALISLGNWTEVERSTAELLPRYHTPDLIIQTALVRMQRKDYRGARPLLEDALRASPEDLRAVTALLGTYSLSKELGAGLQKVQEHVARYPQSAPLQQYLGELLFRNGRLSEARSAFQEAKKADTSGIAADLSLARLDILDRNLDTARGILSRVLTSHPSNADALLLMAEVEMMSNDFEDATRRYREILTQDKDNVVALNNLASLLSEKLARADEAIPYARHAIELAPENADARDTLGWIYYTKKMYPAALKQLEAAAVKQRTARNQFRIAMVHRQIGNEKQSAEYLQRAVSLDPKILTDGQ